MNTSPLIHAAVTMRTRAHAETALCINAAQCVCAYARVAQFVLLKTGAFCWRSFTPARLEPSGCFYRARATRTCAVGWRRPGGARSAIDVMQSGAGQSAPRVSFPAAIQALRLADGRDTR